MAKAQEAKAKDAPPLERLARSIRTDYRTDITEALVELMQPFTPAVVKFKALTKPFDSNGKKVSFVACYMDARMVAERLNHVVGAGGWEDVYRVLDSNPASGLPIECALTVLGVTKRDVGQIAPGKLDDKAWKSAYSDALKRAAVKFGVGLYLYKIPQLKGEVIVGNDGRAKGLTIQAQKELRATYERWLASEFNVFGTALDHGDPLPELLEDDQNAPAVTEPSDDPTVESGAGNGSASPERTQETALRSVPVDDRAATDDEVAALVELAGKISPQARAAVEQAIGRQRAANEGGVVFGSWLGTQVANAMRKLSAKDNGGSGEFAPPAGATDEPTAADVDRAFAEAA
jgi:hypothetical protein